METIATRIMQLVEESGGNMSEFARSIDVTPAYISKLKNKPDSVPSTDVINKIVEKYHVREAWLRRGEEPMRYPEPENSLDIIDALVAQSRSPFPDLVRAILIAYDRASPDGQRLIREFIQQVKSELGEK